jgi:hypothetical protein
MLRVGLEGNTSLIMRRQLKRRGGAGQVPRFAVGAFGRILGPFAGDAGSKPTSYRNRRVQPANTASTHLQKTGRGVLCALRKLAETAWRQIGVVQSEKPIVGYRTQRAVRGRVKAASLKGMPSFETT